VDEGDLNQEVGPGIWPPYEAFYLESLLYCTDSALESVALVGARLERGAPHQPESADWNESAHAILNGVQNIAIQGAGLSRYFWPARNREPHSARAVHLRAGLGIREESPLRDRDLRNQMEHFDEKLDQFCQGTVVGNILPQYVGPFPGEPRVPRHIFRAYYTDQAVFEVLGRRYSMQPIVDEIAALHERLRTCCEFGHRIRTRSEQDR
jgi:hypothetical protein